MCSYLPPALSGALLQSTLYCQCCRGSSIKWNPRFEWSHIPWSVLLPFEKASQSCGMKKLKISLLRLERTQWEHCLPSRAGSGGVEQGIDWCSGCNEHLLSHNQPLELQYHYTVCLPAPPGNAHTHCETYSCFLRDALLFYLIYIHHLLMHAAFLMLNTTELPESQILHSKGTWELRA